MKKFIGLTIFILLIGGILWHQYISNKCMDINYTVNKYFTSGIFNKYKMYDINNTNLYFSNGVAAFIKVTGLSNQTPHREVHYRVLLEKNRSGIWRVSKVYSN